MIIASLLAGILGTMNVWAVNAQHVRFHINDLYMILLMTGWMMFFASIIESNCFNAFLSIIFVLLVLIGIRNQVLINDREYLKGMMPHHSMAIKMSEHILQRTKNEEIKALATDIIESQQKEIDIIENLLKT